MQILVIAATAPEIQPFIDLGSGIDVLVTGVGVPATMYHLQKQIERVHYDLIIQAGIAGAFNADIDLGKTVLVKQDTFGDLGMEEKENFTSIFDSGFADRNKLPFTDGWLINNNKAINTSVLRAVKAVTINKVSDSALQKQQMIKHFNADIESMEGAALHYICLQEKIPFLQLRSVSNYVGERDKSKWKMKEAVANLNAALTQLITQLKDN